MVFAKINENCLPLDFTGTFREAINYTVVGVVLMSPDSTTNLPIEDVTLMVMVTRKKRIAKKSKIRRRAVNQLGLWQ